MMFNLIPPIAIIFAGFLCILWSIFAAGQHSHEGLDYLHTIARLGGGLMLIVGGLLYAAAVLLVSYW